MEPHPPPSVRDILIFVPDRAVGMSITLIKDLCWVAATHAAQEGGSSIDPSQHVRLASLDGDPVRCFSGTELSIDVGLQDAGSPDAVFIGAFWGPPGPIVDNKPAINDWLTTLHNAGIPISAVSNGPYFLAEAGLLDNKVATVYPPAANQFGKRYPSVKLRPERAITDAGNLYCANGIASGCDLIVSIVELLYGPRIARRIAADFLIGFNRDYTISNLSFDAQKYHRDRQILTAQNWLERHYRGDVRLDAVAADVGMSPRNFSRRFKQATGDNPREYLKRVRLEAARDYLKNTDLSVSEIAHRVGYDDIGHFSRLFADHVGCAPMQYREQVE